MNIEKKMLPPVPPPCEYVLTLTEVGGLVKIRI